MAQALSTSNVNVSNAAESAQKMSSKKLETAEALRASASSQRDSHSSPFVAHYRDVDARRDSSLDFGAIHSSADREWDLRPSTTNHCQSQSVYARAYSYFYVYAVACSFGFLQSATHSVI